MGQEFQKIRKITGNNKAVLQLPETEKLIEVTFSYQGVRCRNTGIKYG